MNTRIKYFTNSLVNIRQQPICPYCKHMEYAVVDRKYLVTSLLVCNNCHLYYRHPHDKEDFNLKFYQDEYKETGITTDLPLADRLQEMKASNFRNSEKDFQRIITLIQCLLKNIQEIKIVDYGSSWGYGSYQFLNAGMSVQSFEISSGRADFGNKNLGLNIQKDEKLLEPGNHVFFSSHVIEHHPDIFSMNVLAKKLLLNDGFYIAFCPNGSNEFRERDPKAFHHLWGLVHPNYLNDKFFQYVYSENPYFIGSNPYNFEQLQNWDGHSQFVGDLTGVELFVISRPNIKIKN